MEVQMKSNLRKKMGTETTKGKILLVVAFKATSITSSLYFFCQLLTERYAHIIKLYNTVY